MNFTKEFILKLKKIFGFKTIKEVNDWLESNRSNFYGWKVFSDLSEKEIKTELSFGGHFL